MNTIYNNVSKWVKCFLPFYLLTLLPLSAFSADHYKWERDIRYTVKTDSYAQERLLLDVYYPEGKADVPVVVWFHGGGLEAGQKEVPRELQEKGMVVVGVNYRLLPKVTVDLLLDDAAEAESVGTAHLSGLDSFA